MLDMIAISAWAQEEPGAYIETCIVALGCWVKMLVGGQGRVQFLVPDRKCKVRPHEVVKEPVIFLSVKSA